MPLDTHDLRMIQCSMPNSIRTFLKTSAVDERAATAGLSLNKLCAVAGLNRSALTRLRNGSRSPSAATLAKLAEALDCTIDDLVDVEDVPEFPDGDEAVARASALARYGFECACCGETEYQFLTVTPVVYTDEPRLTMLRRLRVTGYPRSGYLTYCLNCDTAKGQRRECPCATPPRFNSEAARAHWNVKLRVLRTYGAKCFCCGNANPRMLAIDAGGQREALRLLAGRAGADIYRRVAAAGCPPGRFRVTCINCGQFSPCPHRVSAD